MNHFEQCLQQHHWVLAAWNDRYSKGIWLAFVPPEHIENVRSATSLGDLDMETATNFLLSSTLLPIVVRTTLELAMRALNERLGQLRFEDLQRASTWALDVEREYGYFCRENDGGEYGGLRLRRPLDGPFR